MFHIYIGLVLLQKLFPVICPGEGALTQVIDLHIRKVNVSLFWYKKVKEVEELLAQ